MQRPRLLLAAGFVAALAAVVGGWPVPAAADATYDRLLSDAERLLAESERARGAGDEKRSRELARRAHAAARRAFERQPSHTEAVFLAAQAAAFEGDEQSARRWLARYGELTPYRADPYQAYLRAFVALLVDRQPDRAIRALQAMQSIDGRVLATQRDALYWQALIDKAKALSREERYEEAIGVLRQAARLAARKGWPERELAALGSVGTMMRAALRWIEAVALFERLIERDPDTAMWHWQRGLALASQNKWIEAISSYEHVIEMLEAGRVPEVHVEELQEVHMRLGNSLRLLAGRTADDQRRKRLLTRAEAELARFLELQPESPAGHQWMGVLHQRELEQPGAALRYYRRAFELDPICPKPLRALVEIYQRHPDVAAAHDEDWEASLAAWRKDLEENEKKRARALRERELANAGDDGCE